MNQRVKAIDAILPQTQCQECGFAGCLPYAEALAAGVAPIDRCPPGGEATVQALATLLKQDATPYLDQARANTRLPALAVIDEAECIGCTKCIQACPVDAIIGSAKTMHAIINLECTGCGLCVEPCPVDCIELTPLPVASFDKEKARQRFQVGQIRRLQEKQDNETLYRQRKQLNIKSSEEIQAKQQYIQEAILRSMKRKNEYE